MIKIEKDTRKLFHKIHTKQAQDKFTYNRLVNLLSTNFLKVKKDFFKDKICLDAGCGSNANATISMINMGAKTVFPMDLDDTIFEILPETSSDKDKYKLTIGSILDIPFQDNFFDFTHCSGALHHTTNFKKGLSELVRVTKPGCFIFLQVRGQGGIVRDIDNMLRKKYKDDNSFAKIVNDLSIEDIRSFLWWTFSQMKENKDDYAQQISSSMIEELFDEDLVLTIKDRICSPIYHEITYKKLELYIEELGCTKIQRLNRYSKFRNIRRFLAPMYNNQNSKYSKLLYGDGDIVIKFVKQ
jgi:ubiquinone/menaquinone biosynthesis C-methylase UbiE